MKKRIITMLLLVVMVLSLSACGNKAVANTKPSDSNNTAEADANVDSFTPVKFRFANQHPTDSIASEADRRIWVLLKCATFQLLIIMTLAWPRRCCLIWVQIMMS